MEKTENKTTKEEQKETEDLCCSDSNMCFIDCKPKPGRSNRGKSSCCSGNDSCC